jgi:hypothetical protein
MLVTNCEQPELAANINGAYSICGEHHGKTAYKKNEGDTNIYFWAHDVVWWFGPGLGTDTVWAPKAEFHGWWFGPGLGTDTVWAYHPEHTANVPPESGWLVPFQGPIDPMQVVQQPTHDDSTLEKVYYRHKSYRADGRTRTIRKEVLLEEHPLVIKRKADTLADSKW